MTANPHKTKKYKNKSRFKKILIAVLAVSAFLLLYLTYKTHLEAPTDDETIAPSAEHAEPEEEFVEVLLLAAGDVMVHTPQLSQAWDPDQGKYDFSPSFEYISDYIKEADIAVANLETTFGGPERGYDGYPLFNSPDELAHNLKDAGFDLICTANNHSLDSGVEGIYRTVDILEEAGLPSFGTARTPEERDAPIIARANDINIAFLAYTDSTNGIPVPQGKEHIINFIDLNSDPELEEAEAIFQEDIYNARQAGADLVAVYMHWGYEYHFEPNEWQQELANLLAGAGADMVLGSHPHVIQPMETISVSNERGEPHETFVAYSMGNFVSNQFYISGAIPTEEVEYGLVLLIQLEKELNSGEAYIKDVEYMLTWVNRDWRHRIIPLHEALAEDPGTYRISAPKYERLLPVWEKTLERLEGFAPAFHYEE